MSGVPRSACLWRLSLAVVTMGMLYCATSTPPNDVGNAEREVAQDGTVDLPQPKAVDFVVQGCQRSAEQRCEGRAPLWLTFAAVTGGVRGAGEWDFGDGSPSSSGAVVSHIYGRAGVYDVALTLAAAGGTVSEEKQGFVFVVGADPGGACLEDEGCAAGSCICREGCPFPLSGEICLLDECERSGTCAIECEHHSCPAPSICVDLDLTGEAIGPWRRKLCLPTCTEEDDCRRLGFSCHPAPTGAGWQRACLPPVLGEVGSPCRDEEGIPDSAACLGGECLDIGAAGYCSAKCDDRDCPEGTSCVRFAGGEAVGLPYRVCLRRCSSGDCLGDPQLDCRPEGGAGQYGFEIVGPADPSGTTYCAPKRCAQPGECGLSGYCDGGTGGFCRLKL